MDNWMERLSKMFDVEVSPRLPEARPGNGSAFVGPSKSLAGRAREVTKPQAALAGTRGKKVWPCVP